MVLISWFHSIRKLLTVDGHNNYGQVPGAFSLLPGIGEAMQVLLAVVVDWTFTLGGGGGGVVGVDVVVAL